MKTVIRIGYTGLLSFACLLSMGCSTFNRDWKKAGIEPPPSTGLSGRWQGTWLSDANQHTGPLRCIIVPQAGGTYTARFHAKYQKLFTFSFGYTVDLRVEQAGDRFQFEGEADLGWLAGGVYRYQGEATPTNFFSTYRSERDHGTFQMQRPER